MGYFKDPELTARAFSGEYLKTGDKGVIDPDGYLKITGRVKDLFKTSKGKYVAPAHIELLINQSPWVDHVCVVGSGLPQPLALVVLNSQAKKFTPEKVTQYFSPFMRDLNQQLDSHERIKNMVVISEPWTIENNFLTPTLKVKRNHIEASYKEHFEPWSQQGLQVLIH